MQNKQIPLMCLLAAFLFLPHTTFGDDIADALKAAKEKHKLALESAKEKVVLAYRERIIEKNQSGDTEIAAGYLRQLTFFEQKGGLTARKEMVDVFKKYGLTLKTAGDELKKAYATAMRARLDNGETSAVEQLQDELTEESLPTDLVSFTQSGRRYYMVQGGYLVNSKSVRSDVGKLNATWEIVNGLANSNYVSIRSPSIEGHYLIHGGLRVRYQEFVDTDSFRQNATFIKKKGLIGRKRGVSFESINFPKHFIRRRANGELWVDKDDGSAAFKTQATFYQTAPQFRLW